MSTHTRQNAGQ